jgi:hypothetical protein
MKSKELELLENMKRRYIKANKNLSIFKSCADKKWKKKSQYK